MANSKNLIMLFKIIGLCMMGMGCSSRATHQKVQNCGPQIQFVLTQKDNEAKIKRTKTKTKATLIERLNSAVMNFKDRRKSKQINTMLELVEKYPISSLQKRNPTGLNHACYVCRCGISPSENFYKVMCCQNNLHNDCLALYLLRLRKLSNSMRLCNLAENEVFIKLCCESSKDLYNHIAEIEKQNKAVKADHSAIARIERSLIKAQNLVPYNALFTCYICMNHFEQDVYVFECAECKNKVCLTCIAKSIHHYGSILKCYFCRATIPGCINSQRDVNRHFISLLSSCRELGLVLCPCIIPTIGLPLLLLI
ncbi:MULTISPECIES: hypothetical protein [unclassified Candidatus Cardinium]|uniref:hypothetical protein n=1 Tax=unclassified Candidatus Cardinium TaxID=2641185 RepID=UPI001FB2014B|nr:MULTISPECIES: hypothetical protein [unclassified Candidatus Cardinium]